MIRKKNLSFPGIPIKKYSAKTLFNVTMLKINRGLQRNSGNNESSLLQPEQR